MRIFLTRHGQTKYNLENRFQGQKDSPLTTKGIKAAEALRDYLKEEDIDFVVSSPLARARLTAEIIKGEKKWPVYYYQEFMELDFGDWEAAYIPEIENHALYQLLHKTPEKFQAPNGESLVELKKRVVKQLKFLHQNNPDKSILLVVHGIVIRVLLTYFYQSGLSNFYNLKYPYGCSLSLIDYQDDDNITVIFESEISHLNSEVLTR